jgi:hypothetical protein
MPVDLVTIHHEAGPGPLPTAEQCDRFSEGGYCAGIGTDTFRWWRAPADNWATMNFNGQDLTLCFGGDRHTEHRVSDHDLAVVHDAFMYSYQRGEVTAQPQVRAHRDSPGSSTACPGDYTMQRWDEVVNACRADGAPSKPTEEDDDPMDLANATNHDGRPVVFQVGGDARLYYRIRDATSGDWGGWQDLSSGKSGFATVTAWANQDPTKKLEVWVTMKDGKTFQRWQTDDYAGWVPWTDRTR